MRVCVRFHRPAEPRLLSRRRSGLGAGSLRRRRRGGEIVADLGFSRRRRYERLGRRIAPYGCRTTNVRYTELAGVDHNAWDPAYDDSDMAAWLLDQRRR